MKKESIFRLAIGILFVMLGLIVLNRVDAIWGLIYYVSVVVLSLLSVFYLYHFIKKRVWIDLLKLSASLILVLSIMSYQNIYIGFLAGFFGVWALFNAFVHILELYLAYRDQRHEPLTKVLYFLFDLTMGILLIVNGFQNRRIASFQVGIYLLGYGLIQVYASITDKINLRMSLPVFISAILPPILVARVDKMKKKYPNEFKLIVEPTLPKHVSIYIHIRDEGYSRMGHIDIGYNGAIYSYGSYDENNRSKNGIYGDGVLVVGSESEFINFNIGTERKTVYRYLLKLTEEESNHIEKKIDELFLKAYHMDYVGVGDEYYLGRLLKESSTMDFYKFNDEPFKTYNLFTTNCVMLADYIVQSTGMKLFKMSGVITPGAYYSYLDKLLGIENSNVIERMVYAKKELK